MEGAGGTRAGNDPKQEIGQEQKFTRLEFEKWRRLRNRRRFTAAGAELPVSPNLHINQLADGINQQFR